MRKFASALIRVGKARQMAGLSKSAMLQLIRQGILTGVTAGKKQERYSFVTAVSLEKLLAVNGNS